MIDRFNSSLLVFTAEWHDVYIIFWIDSMHTYRQNNSLYYDESFILRITEMKYIYHSAVLNRYSYIITINIILLLCSSYRIFFLSNSIRLKYFICKNEDGSEDGNKEGAGKRRAKEKERERGGGEAKQLPHRAISEIRQRVRRRRSAARRYTDYYSTGSSCSLRER